MARLYFCSTTTGGSYCSYVEDEAEDKSRRSCQVIKDSSRVRNPSWGASQDGRPRLMKFGEKGRPRGGACNYGKTVESPPISKLTVAAGNFIFRKGYGCGSCYEVKCTDNAACSGKSVTVVVSDECSSCSGYHFNLSGAAFASIANPGQQDTLRKLGQVNLQYRRVSCSFGNFVAVRIGENSRPPTYMEASIEYVNGDAEYIDLEVRDQSFLTVSRVGGATWSFFFAGYNLQPPMTLTLTQRYSNGTKGNTIQLPNIIPIDWKIGQVYQSKTNF
ncbi:putative expansin-B2 [Arachis hypogaea]|uniref:putative expansin-B2 n=1 Tax=Arachis hypogaea TaxID=3818 RepID=UPI000DEC0531|nr:putative expansin-B2 [Arachis hypogaea]